jgi:hypothetical protein
MPYEVAFTRRVPVLDREEYINECCIGGDAVVNHLLPQIEARYPDIETNQEDWGWFIWFRKGPVRLAVDVFTDDPDRGSFRLHLTSRLKRLFVHSVIDTSELEELRTLVVSELAAWAEDGVSITRLDRNYREIEDVR